MSEFSTSDLSPSAKQRYLCEVCNTEFNMVSALVSHRLIHAEKENSEETRVPKSKFQITRCRNKENHIADEANINATPKTARTLKDTLTVFGKHAKKPTAHLLLHA
ncbi:hypothetical protein TNIN_82151 [Trichonephila inaurata madagascariensis]|uniref:C2H2-type domain-containing protein n=1 Tax=Trichonephila inaurata madagascariensis TaxID=2747483 RepID=A0A8X6Y229_9ARAC|nr:hypothetical protein TNIN_82151 [Trichonephila inaurata madagascariensis]